MKTGKMPKQMTAVTPYLTVKDLDAAVEFYQKVFGFETKYTMPGPHGKAVHAEFLHGGCTIMVGCENPTCGSAAPTVDPKNSAFGLYLYVEDVDKFFAGIKTGGVTVKEEPHDMFWGDRICAVVDPFGHHWSFGTFVREVSPEECQKAIMEMARATAH